MGMGILQYNTAATLAFALAFIANAQAQSNQPAAGSGPSTAAPATSTATTWTAKMLLSDESRHFKCTTRKDEFKFTLTGERFLVTSGPVRIEGVVENGRVSATFWSPGGYDILLSGDVRTKQMSLTNIGFKCKWDLIPN